MKAKASSGRSRKSVFEHCESLDLRATHPSEAQLLGWLHGVLFGVTAQHVRQSWDHLRDVLGRYVETLEQSPALPAGEGAGPAAQSAPPAGESA